MTDNDYLRTVAKHIHSHAPNEKSNACKIFPFNGVVIRLIE